MQPHQNSRIDVAELKTQIVKKIGAERSKRYFYYLNRLLSQKLSKSEFDRLCFRVIGRENLALHNHFIRSILKNAFQAKTPPLVHEVGPAKPAIVAGRSSSREDGHEHSGCAIPGQTPRTSAWSNGVVLPKSPRKGRSAIRDRKLRDRPSPLGPNGNADSASHQTTTAEYNGPKAVVENGTLNPCDYQRPMQHPQRHAEQPDNDRTRINDLTDVPVSLCKEDQLEVAVVEDGEEVKQANHLSVSRSPLLAPLGIPFCSASLGGAHKALPVACTSNVVSFFDSGGLSDTETLRKRMEQIAEVQGLGGVSLECATMLNNLLDVYLKRLIRSCIELVGARSAHESKRNSVNKLQVQGKLMNGMWPSNHSYMQSSSGPVELMQEARSHRSISLLDFKVAMELNPQQLGENWPLLLEKICMNAFEE